MRVIAKILLWTTIGYTYWLFFDFEESSELVTVTWPLYVVRKIGIEVWKKVTQN